MWFTSLGLWWGSLTSWLQAHVSPLQMKQVSSSPQPKSKVIRASFCRAQTDELFCKTLLYFYVILGRETDFHLLDSLARRPTGKKIQRSSWEPSREARLDQNLLPGWQSLVCARSWLLSVRIGAGFWILFIFKNLNVNSCVWVCMWMHGCCCLPPFFCFRGLSQVMVQPIM